MKEEYISINKIAEAKGLKSNRSIRLEINKPESKYISREVKVNGGTSYEILYSSLEPEIQQKIRENETVSTALVPLKYKPQTFVSESTRLTALARVDIVKALLTILAMGKNTLGSNIKYLKYFTNKYILIPDNDEAGIKGSERIKEEMNKYKLKLKRIYIKNPNLKDVADVYTNEDWNSLKKCIEKLKKKLNIN
jgi:hypothetical protein